ncbi:hypothetical protein JVT61DRAFT_13756 [Boletus reticuloceps]|uniref:Uncharacterized protein n=1 Tax=Boletus reticuloceps TaxID=495285 RepID=A0A8I2YU51_9AGAM|nr:hypothetical protein JVT61DRAFT_13756 [Boletus reticuloceps]
MSFPLLGPLRTSGPACPLNLSDLCIRTSWSVLAPAVFVAALVSFLHPHPAAHIHQETRSHAQIPLDEFLTLRKGEALDVGETLGTDHAPLTNSTVPLWRMVALAFIALVHPYHSCGTWTGVHHHPGDISPSLCWVNSFDLIINFCLRFVQLCLSILPQGHSGFYRAKCYSRTTCNGLRICIPGIPLYGSQGRSRCSASLVWQLQAEAQIGAQTARAWIEDVRLAISGSAVPPALNMAFGARLVTSPPSSRKSCLQLEVQDPW